MRLTIREDDPTAGPAAGLIRAHLEHAELHSPSTSIHALGADSLIAPDITFWTIWADDALAGCGALKELDRRHGELKSMHTAEAFRGNGIAGRMAAHIIDEARRRSYQRLSLETGSMDGFAPARALYGRLGFEYCPPFAYYRLDPNSVFMTLDLTEVPPDSR